MRGLPEGSHCMVGSFDCADMTERCRPNGSFGATGLPAALPYAGLFASNFAFPSGVNGGTFTPNPGSPHSWQPPPNRMPVSPARLPKRPQTPEKSRGSNLVWAAAFVV